jgi:non-ribosomal peptide synthetase component E (peptide arylation enzyme)
VAAFVVARGPLSAADVRSWVRSGLADYAVPRRVELVDDLPRGTIGKVDKTALRARLSKTGACASP